MSLRDFCINYINRTQNNVSDSLAKLGRGEGRTITWLGSGPEVALSLAFDDCKDLVIE